MYKRQTLKNQIGENIDDQITHIIVEISKFDKKETDIQTDLDKLIFLMKNLEKILDNIQLPHFLSEDWIDQAIKKLDRSKMTPEQRMHFEMSLAKQASILEMIKEERRQLRREVKEEIRVEVRDEVKEEVSVEIKKEVRDEVKEEVRQELREETNKTTAQKMKNKGIEISIISEITGLSIEEIKELL